MALPYPTAVLADSPSIYYRMDDLSGTTCAPLAGGNGLYQNTPTLGVSGCTADSDSGVRFSAASSQNMISNPAANRAPIADVFTIEMWMKFTSLAQSSVPYLAGGNAAQVQINADNTLSIVKGGVAALGTTSAKIQDTTTWHHFVWTKNGATNKVYLDAVDVTPTITNQTFTTGGTNADQWAGFPGFFYNGALDELAVYTSALSAARVSAHFAAASQIPASPTLSKSPPPSIVGRVPGGPKQHPHPPHPSPGGTPPPPPPSPQPYKRGLIEGERLK